MKFRTDFKQLTGKYDDSFQKAGKFFASGSKIATGGTDGTPRVWNVEGYSKAECMFQMEGAHADELTDVSISVDGTVFASASKRKIVLWEIKESGKQMRTISIEDQAFRSVFFIDNQLYYTLVDAQKTTTLRQCEPSTETSDYIYSFKKTPMSCVRVK